MPNIIPCSNTYCDGYADRIGGYCDKCKQKEAKQKADSWKWRGWSRQSEREEATGKHHRQDGAK
jgi:hypothetical protein